MSDARSTLAAMTLAQLLPLLQLAVGPVIVISGVGLILLSMTNRYARVIDRARALADALRRGAEGPSLREALTIIRGRARRLRLAIALTSLSLLLVALLIVCLFVASLLGAEAANAVIALFVAGMVSLIGALVLFIVDVNTSLAVLRLELDAHEATR